MDGKGKKTVLLIQDKDLNCSNIDFQQIFYGKKVANTSTDCHKVVWQSSKMLQNV